jgi:hypothetical protein
VTLAAASYGARSEHCRGALRKEGRHLRVGRGIQSSVVNGVPAHGQNLPNRPCAWSPNGALPDEAQGDKSGKEARPDAARQLTYLKRFLEAETQHIERLSLVSGEHPAQ